MTAAVPSTRVIDEPLHSMGLYDTVRISGPDPRFVCSEGHDLTGAEFQSKDFGETMGTVTIAGDTIAHDVGDAGEPEAHPHRGRYAIYCSCTRCPAFVTNGRTGRGGPVHNLVEVWVEFELEVVDDEIRSVERVSPSTAEWLAEESRRDYLENAFGPMPYADAVQLHRELRSKQRP